MASISEIHSISFALWYPGNSSKPHAQAGQMLCYDGSKIWIADSQSWSSGDFLWMRCVLPSPPFIRERLGYQEDSETPSPNLDLEPPVNPLDIIFGAIRLPS